MQVLALYANTTDDVLCLREEPFLCETVKEKGKYFYAENYESTSYRRSCSAHHTFYTNNPMAKMNTQQAYDWEYPMPYKFGVFGATDGDGRKKIDIAIELLRMYDPLSPKIASRHGLFHLPAKVADLRARGWDIRLNRRIKRGQESTYTLISEPDGQS